MKRLKRTKPAITLTRAMSDPDLELSGNDDSEEKPAIEGSSGDSSDMDPPRPRQRAYELLGPMGQVVLN